MSVKSANIIARVEPEIKEKAEAIMASLGVPASVVINALYHQIIYTKGIPFSIVVPPSVPVLEELSEEEFDDMLSESIGRMKKGDGKPVEKVFGDIRDKHK